MTSTHSGSSRSVEAFLDLQASVSNDDHESDLSERESDRDFTVDNPEELDSVNRTNAYRWADLDEWDEDAQNAPAFLENLAQEIRDRHRARVNDGGSSGFLGYDDETIPPFPTDEDSIWRVKVKTGMERDVVVAILQKALILPSNGILSAFCRDAIMGSVYIESREPCSKIIHFLEGIAGILRSSHGKPSTSMIDVHDRHFLLSMDSTVARPPVKSFSWVRLKRGANRGDLGLVKSVNKRTLMCSIYVVPRIAMTRKRKRGTRPPQQPFNLASVLKIFGPREVEQRGQVYLFKGEEYEYTFLRKEFHATDLCINAINATSPEFDPFRRISELWNRSDKFLNPIRVGDRVRVVAGAFVGIVGRIYEVMEKTVQIVNEQEGDQQQDTSHGQVDIREVLTRDIRREFEVGDFVQVVHGDDRGLEGFLVSLDRNIDVAVIYVLPQDNAGLHLDAGNEVSVSIADIECKSGARDLVKDEGIPQNATPSVSIRRESDPYKHMEVLILKGDAKSHFGIIKASRRSDDGRDLFDVLTSTRTINTTFTYHIQELQERFTRLPINKARWIPVHFRRPHAPPRPPTPIPSPQANSDAFSTNIPNDSAISTGLAPEPINIPGEPSGPLPGEWLLDPRLLLKKLDIRISGTTSTVPHWQGGKFENQLGFVVLTQKVYSVEESIPVKAGFAENRAILQIRHLVPERTMNTPSFRLYSPSNTSITASPGCRVVIIGQDIENCSDYIGNYAIISTPPYPIAPSCALVQIATPGIYWGKYIYIDVDCLCRSQHPPGGALDWFGKAIL